MSLYIDLTEFLMNPITTGIQRIVCEICRYLPSGAAIPVRLHSGRYIALTSALIDAIRKHFKAGGESGVAEIRQLGAAEHGAPMRMSQDDSLLVPEVFFDPQRVAFFREMAEEQLRRHRFIVYDLLPMTHPEYFPPEGIAQMYGYYQLLGRAHCCGFISECTRDAYYRRLKRTDARGGVVLPLGCDSLGSRAERPALNRPLTFSVLGTIEPRKNHELILEAFEPLLRQIDGLSLFFIGKMGWVDSKFSQKIQALASDKDSGFRLYPDSDDGEIRSLIEQSRATIYISAAEGYGLPPVESLWVGTPIIASTTIPSLRGLGALGIQYVEPLTAANLRLAVLAFLEDAYAERKIEETAHLKLPTWCSFTQDVLHWCTREIAGGQR